MTEHLLDVLYAFCPVIFHRGFPMTEGVQVDLLEFGVLKYSDESGSLFGEACADRVCPSVEYVFACSRHIVQHCYRCWRYFDNPGVAAFYWIVYFDRTRLVVYVDPFYSSGFGSSGCCVFQHLEKRSGPFSASCDQLIDVFLCGDVGKFPLDHWLRCFPFYVKGLGVAEGKKPVPEHYRTWEKKLDWVDQNVREITKALTSQILQFGNINHRASGPDYVFFRGQPNTKTIFVGLFLTKPALKVRIRTDPATFKDPKKWTGEKNYSWFFKTGNEKEFKLTTSDQLDYAMDLIKQSYQLSK